VSVALPVAPAPEFPACLPVLFNLEAGAGEGVLLEAPFFPPPCLPEGFLEWPPVPGVLLALAPPPEPPVHAPSRLHASNTGCQSGNRFNHSQGIDVGMMYHVILDPARETLIKLMPEGRIAPLGEKRKLVEFNDISRNLVAMFHATELAVQSRSTLPG
jgi:hypothetical protein